MTVPALQIQRSPLLAFYSRLIVLLTLLCSGLVPAHAAPVYSHAKTAQKAGQYDALLKQTYKARTNSYKPLMRRGMARFYGKDYRRAIKNFGASYVAGGGTRALLKLSASLLYVTPKTYQERYTFPERAASAAYLAYKSAAHDLDRAEALKLLGYAFIRRQWWRDSLTALKASLAHREQRTTRAKYDEVYKKHGFRMIDYNIDSDSVSPRLCINFSEKLNKGEDYSKYIVQQGNDKPAVTVSNRRLCIEGLQHGLRYKVKLRTGLPAQIEDDLKKNVELSVYVKDRSPSVRLAGNKYVLPRNGQTGIPVTSTNTKKVHIGIFRFSDRALNRAIDGNFLNQLAGYNVDELKARSGEEIWSGTLDVVQKLNKDVVTAFPVQKAIPDMKSGVYVMVADAKKNAESWKEKATQWFIISDLGLTGLSTDNGVHAFVRSLYSADMMPDVTIRLIAKNNEVLDTQITDGGGFASFSKSIANGTGGMSPALLVAQTNQGDYAFLDLTKPAFDLSDRGVQGRKMPGPVDVQLFTERGIYKPGETVHLTGLTRNKEANALKNLPLTFKFIRPDGREYKRTLVKDQGLGGRSFSLTLPTSAKTGTWRALAYTNVKEGEVGETTFLVEDFVPERMDLDLVSQTERLSTNTPLLLDVDGKYLYGAPARDHALEGEMVIGVNKSPIKGFKGYQFGLADEKFKTVRNPLSALPRTDQQGKARIRAELPNLPDTTKPLRAKLTLRLRDPSGRTIERKLSLPVASTTPLIGIRPLFDDLSENSTAEFDVAVMGVDGQRRAFKNLTWEIVQLHTRYQ